MARTPTRDQEEGLSCGLGVEFCPEVFRLNDRDVSEVHNPTGAPDDKTQEASDRRPVQGIPWE